MIFTGVYAQNKVDNIIHKEILDAKEGRYSFIILKQYCVDADYIYEPGSTCDKSEYPYEIFIITFKEALSAIKKYDNCGIYNLKKDLLAENVITFARDNLEKIKVEYVEKFDPDGKSPIQIGTVCLYKLIVGLGSETISKEFEDTGTWDDENLKLHNSTLKLKTLIRSLSQT